MLEQVVLSLRQADTFDSGASVLQPSTSGILALSADGIVTQFSRVGSELRVAVDGTNYGDITSDVLYVDGFTVYRYPTTVGEFVRVEVNLRASIGTASRSETFYGGAVLRGDL